MKILKWVIEFIAIFIGLYLGDVVMGFIPTDSWIIEMAVTVAIVVAMMYVAGLINGFISKNKKDK